MQTGSLRLWRMRRKRGHRSRLARLARRRWQIVQRLDGYVEYCPALRSECDKGNSALSSCGNRCGEGHLPSQKSSMQWEVNALQSQIAESPEGLEKDRDRSSIGRLHATIVLFSPRFGLQSNPSPFLSTVYLLLVRKGLHRFVVSAHATPACRIVQDCMLAT